MYYSGSQRCVDAGTYKGKAKDPAHPERSDQRLFKLGLAKSKDGRHFARHSAAPVFSFGDDVHSVVTAAILKNPDGSVHRENGRLRMYFAAVDFPGGTYKHDLYETTSADGVVWDRPTLVMENAYAPCVIKEGARYRMWYTWIDKHPWHTNYAESTDGTRWTIHEKPCIIMNQTWEVKDQVYPMVVKAGDVYLMMYGCYWEDDKHTALGFAVSRDGLSWTKHPGNPVFRPEPGTIGSRISRRARRCCGCPTGASGCGTPGASSRPGATCTSPSARPTGRDPGSNGRIAMLAGGDRPERGDHGRRHH